MSATTRTAFCLCLYAKFRIAGLRDMFNRVANDLRAGLLGAVLDRPMPDVERESVGDLMARGL